MNQEQFDKHFRQQIAPEKTAIDTADLWQAIEPELPPQKRKRRLGIWFLVPIAMGMLTYLWWMSSPSNTTRPAMTPPLSTTASSPSWSTPDETSSTSKKRVSNRPTENSNDKALLVEGVPSQKPISRTPRKTKATQNGNIRAEIQTFSLQTHPEISSKTGDAVAMTQTAIATTPKQEERSQSAQEAQQATTHKKTFMVNAASLSVPTCFLLADTPNLSIKEPAEDTSEETPKRKSSKTNWVLEAASGAALPIRQLQASEQGMAWVDKRLETENTQLSPSYQLTVHKQFSKMGWYVLTGLSYTRLQTVLEYRLQSETEVWDENGISSIVISAGDTTVYRAGNSQRIITNRHRRQYNQFHLLDIPVLLGKEFTLTDRWYVGIEGGLALNLKMLPRGVFLNNLGDTYVEQTYVDSFYKNQVGWSLIGGLNMSYQLSEAMYLKAGLRYQNYLNNFIQEGINQSDKYGLLGTHLGFQYRW